MDKDLLKKIKIVFLALENLDYDDNSNPKFNKRLKSFTNLVNQYYKPFGKMTNTEVSEIMGKTLKDLFNVNNIEL